MPELDAKKQELSDWCDRIGLKSKRVKGMKKKRVVKTGGPELVFLNELVKKVWQTTASTTPKEHKYTLRYNFGGSGMQAWKTHCKIEEDGVVDMDKVGDQLGEGLVPKGMKAYETTTFGTDTDDFDVRITLEYAGPLAKKGILDSGENSTSETIRNALQDIKFKLDEIKKRRDLDGEDDGSQKVLVQIKGFSRGAAAASAFTKKVDEKYSDIVEIESAFFDAVHGGGRGAKGGYNHYGPNLSQQPHQQDISSVSGSIIGSVRILPITAQWNNLGFTPQALKGCKVVLVVYGTNAKHDIGQSREFMYKGRVLESTDDWKTIPNGLWKVDSTHAKGATPEDILSGASTANQVEIEQVKTTSQVETLLTQIWSHKQFRMLDTSAKQIAKEVVLGWTGFFSEKYYDAYSVKVQDNVYFENRDLEILRVIEELVGGKFIKEYIEWYNKWRASSGYTTSGGITDKWPEAINYDDIIPFYDNIWADAGEMITNIVTSLERGDSVEEAKAYADKGGTKNVENTASVELIDVQELQLMMDSAKKAMGFYSSENGINGLLFPLTTSEHFEPVVDIADGLYLGSYKKMERLFKMYAGKPVFTLQKKTTRSTRDIPTSRPKAPTGTGRHSI